MLHELLQGLVAQTAQAPAQNPIMGFVPFILIFAVMYFLIIRPQQKQAKEQENFIGQLKKGDEVVLQSGFIVKVLSVGTTDLTVELSSGVKARVLKSSVAGPVKAEAADAKKDDADKGEAKK